MRGGIAIVPSTRGRDRPLGPERCQGGLGDGREVSGRRTGLVDGALGDVDRVGVARRLLEPYCVGAVGVAEASAAGAVPGSRSGSPGWPAARRRCPASGCPGRAPRRPVRGAMTAASQRVSQTPRRPAGRRPRPPRPRRTTSRSEQDDDEQRQGQRKEPQPRVAQTAPAASTAAAARSGRRQAWRRSAGCGATVFGGARETSPGLTRSMRLPATAGGVKPTSRATRARSDRAWRAVLVEQRGGHACCADRCRMVCRRPAAAVHRRGEREKPVGRRAPAPRQRSRRCQTCAVSMAMCAY